MDVHHTFTIQEFFSNATIFTLSMEGEAHIALNLMPRDRKNAFLAELATKINLNEDMHYN